MTSTGERFYEAELRRLQGELWLARAAAHRQAAEHCFQEALTTARQQQAKSWEVQAALSLSRLWHEEGKRDAARKLLDGVCEGSRNQVI
jgi:predicted ATPase